MCKYSVLDQDPGFRQNPYPSYFKTGSGYESLEMSRTNKPERLNKSCSNHIYGKTTIFVLSFFSLKKEP